MFRPYMILDSGHAVHRPAEAYPGITVTGVYGEIMQMAQIVMKEDYSLRNASYNNLSLSETDESEAISSIDFVPVATSFCGSAFFKRFLLSR